VQYVPPAAPASATSTVTVSLPGTGGATNPVVSSSITAN
jgi:hypothetical protein